MLLYYERPGESLLSDEHTRDMQKTSVVKEQSSSTMISISESKLGLSHWWLLRPSKRYGTLQSGFLTQRLPITEWSPTDGTVERMEDAGFRLHSESHDPKMMDEKMPSFRKCFLHVPQATQHARTFPCWVLLSISRHKRKHSKTGDLSLSPSSKAWKTRSH